MPYLLTHSWENEHARLATLADALDPATTHRLVRLGVSPGWRCLEVGGGGGSIARWLCQQVGPDGYVVATDLETDILSTIAAPNLEVRQHDICVDALESNTFDLVHCRAVLEHLPAPARQVAIRRMIGALKPGGWLLVEDGDTATFRANSTEDQALFGRCASQFETFIISHGAAPHYGRHLRSELIAAGLHVVMSDGFMFEWGGDLPPTAIWLYNYWRMRDQVVEAGLLSAEEVDAFLTMIERPTFRAMSPTLMMVWGRKPLVA